MSARCRQRGQVMIILLGALLFGGSVASGVIAAGKPVKALRKDLKSIPLESARRDEALTLLKRWEGLAKSTAKVYGQRTDAIMDLMGRQSATRQDFERAFASQSPQLAQVEQDLATVRNALRTTLRREEWNALFGVKPAE